MSRLDDLADIELVQEFKRRGCITWDVRNLDRLHRLAVLGTERKWRPIKSAPKNEPGKRHGPSILGYGENGIIEKCWWEISGGLEEWVTNGGLTFYPTHWMPKPDAPEEGI